MHLLHKVAGSQQIGLAGARRGAAHVHAADGSLLADDDGAAGCCLEVGGVAHENAGHVRDGVMHGHTPDRVRFARKTRGNSSPLGRGRYGARQLPETCLFYSLAVVVSRSPRLPAVRIRLAHRLPQVGGATILLRARALSMRLQRHLVVQVEITGKLSGQSG